MKVRKITAAFIASLMVVTITWNANAQTPDQERAAEDLREANAVSKRHRAELMKIPHVRVVTGEVNSRSEAAILIEVDDQKNVDEVMRKAPSQIEGFPVEVDEFPSEDESRPARPEPGHWGEGRLPTIDKNGYYHHAWLKPPAAAATPDALQ